MSNYIQNITDEFYRWFDILNQEYFKNELQQPIITIQKTKRNIGGHFTLDKVWKSRDNDEDSNYEINIAAHVLHEEIDYIIGILLHEMVHQYNKVNNIKDCSGNVHNKKFMRRAAEASLMVEQTKSSGWGFTYPSKELKEFIASTIKPNQELFVYARIPSVKEKQEKEKKKRTFKFICGKCGMEAKGKDTISIICGKCNEIMGKEQEDE